jgi:uncharacterized protein (UPF0332 family)
MSLNEEERRIIVKLELEKATNTMTQIPELQKLGYWDNIANRLYYAVFHAVNALLIREGLEINRHKSSHALFSLHYIKTGKLPAEFGRLYNNLQTMREKSDYNCFYNVTEAEIAEGIELAGKFIAAAKEIAES